MNVDPPSIQTAPGGLGSSRLGWDRVRHFHKDPELIALWCRLLGPLLRWLTPPRRRFLLSGGAIVAAIKYPLVRFAHTRDVLGQPNPLGVILLFLAISVFVLLCYAVARNFASMPLLVRRHPQVFLHAVLLLPFVVLWIAQPPNGAIKTGLLGCVLVLPHLVWRLGYMLFTAQRGKMKSTKLRDHLLYIFPVWGGSNTPYGKGLDYLSAHEARDEISLARSQLSGMKLFVLAGILTIVKGLLAGVVFGRENIYQHTFGSFSPPVPETGAIFSTPAIYPLWLRWVALYMELIWSVVSLAISGHIIVGWLRFFGFNVFRNTYKPLLAESVIEFWNRYYYYFKELLVNFFFLPTFSRHFKQSPRLRLFAAVFMAAFVGNMYYHWLALDLELATADFHGMWTALHSRFFYCFLLASGIFVSMLRAQRRPNPPRPRSMPRRALAIFGVWTFFSLIDIWQEKSPALFSERVSFFLGLFGLN